MINNSTSKLENPILRIILPFGALLVFYWVIFLVPNTLTISQDKNLLLSQEKSREIQIGRAHV